ncbi:MAG: hypothetical protein NTW29_10740 [Bacteroidetes bacterium]|nr:hypothetical protein [Bacteroidota bacterium]
MEGRIKLGFSLGITGSDKWEYFVVSYNPVRDSITRGVEYRNYTPVFPMLTTGTDLTFWVSGVLGMSLGLNYQKGFIKIIEQDIYYNDGSGFNDQRAKQWGTGDFIGLQFGVRYKLKKRKTE